MVGDDQPLVCRHLVQAGTNLFVNLLDLGAVCIGVGRDLIFRRRIGRNQRRLHLGRRRFEVGEVVPPVWVGLTVAVRFLLIGVRFAFLLIGVRFAFPGCVADRQPATEINNFSLRT